MSAWKASLTSSTSKSGEGKKREKPSKAQFQPVFEEPEEGEAEEEGFEHEYGRGGGHGMDYYEEEEEEQEGYFPQRGYYRSDEAYEGPSSWNEVDESQLDEDAVQLFDSVTRSVQAELLEKLFAANAVETKEMLDPLGLGALDVDSKKIVKQGTQTKRSMVRGKRWEQACTAAKATQRRQKQRSSEVNGSVAVQRSSQPQASRSAGGDGQASAQVDVSKPGAVPPDVAIVLPNQEAFVSEAFLGTFHQETRESALRQGVKSLTQELSERTGQLKQLIRENFERFTSCQSTIDDIYAKLRQAEGMGFAAASGPKPMKKGKDGAVAAAPAPVGGPEGLQRTLAAVQAAGQATWGDVLDRAQKVERIRSVANLLNRFNNLFGMPGRIKALASEGSLAQIVAEYQRASALIRPTANSARVWVTLYQEIEKRVVEVYQASKATLADPHVDTQLAADLIIFMAQLSKERLPGTRDEDAVRVFLDNVHQQLDKGMAECDLHLARRLARLNQQLNRDPAARSAALDFAAAWKLQGPSAWQLEPVTRPEDDVMPHADSLPLSASTLAPHRAHKAPAAAAADDSDEEDDDSDYESGDDEEGTAGEEEEGGEAAAAAAGTRLAGTAKATPQELDVPPGPPAPPSTLEDLAVLMWPGTNDWRPELDLTPALRSDLQWRLAPTTPRSALLPEPSFRLAPAQSAWAEYVAELCAVLVGRMPGLWAVANSPKFSQVPPGDVPGSVLDSMSRAPSLARRLVDGVMQRYAGRVQAALQALSQAGPLCPAVELVIKELCRSWAVLQSSGTTNKAADGIRSAALSALTLYGVCLQTHLASVPQMLFDNETWSLDVTLMEQQPVTLMPSQLQDELCLVMFHFGVLAGRVRDVDESGCRAAWSHLRDGLFTCLAAYTSCVNAYTASLQPRLMAGRAGGKRTEGGGGQRGLSKAISMRVRSGEDTTISGRGASSAAAVREAEERVSQLDQAALTLSLAPLPSGALDAMQLTDGIIATLANTTPAQGALVQPARTDQQPGNNTNSSAFAAAAAQQPTPMPRLARQAAAHAGEALGRADEARLLVVVSNAIWVRAHVAPDVAQRYQQLLAGAEEDCEGAYTSLVSTRCSELSRASRALLDVFLQHKRQQATDNVDAYISLTCAAGEGGGVNAADGAGHGVPTGVSDPALALVTCLVDVYTLVVSYCPRSTLATVMPALVQHMAQELRARCDSLPSPVASHALLQLYLDLDYMDRAWQGAATEAARQDLAAGLLDLRGLLAESLQGRASEYTGLLAQLARASKSRSGAALGRELSSWAQPLLTQCMQKNQCSVSCFSVAAAEV